MFMLQMMGLILQDRLRQLFTNIIANALKHQQFREMGVKDKAAGVSAETAQQRIKEFHSEKFLQSLRSTTTFAGRKYTDSDMPSPEKMKLLADTISAVYLDGYEGRQ